jgi:formylglycine-generating enzyme required for sulfatase activity/serine/threonine protein kinase
MPEESTWPGSGEALPPGATLLGVYEILGVLGGGGMGRVYRAQHNHLGMLRAIKVIRPDLTAGPNVRNQFIREARVLMEINHDAVARCHELLTDSNGCLYLVMELVEGPSLETLLHSGPLDTLAVRALWQRMAEGLAAIHLKGIVHRDISPGNIVLPGGNPEKAKLIDFGVASLAAAETIGMGEFKGKLSYASPEQLGQYGGKVEGKSDIYTFGLVLAEAASGVKAYRTPYETRIPPNVPAELREDILKLIEPDPAMRPDNAFPAPPKVIGGSVKTQTSPAVTPGIVPPADGHRSSFLAAKIALLVLLLCVIGLGVLWQLQRREGNSASSPKTGAPPKETVIARAAPPVTVPLSPLPDGAKKGAPPKSTVTAPDTPPAVVPAPGRPDNATKSAPPNETVAKPNTTPVAVPTPHQADDGNKSAPPAGTVTTPAPAPPVVQRAPHVGDSKVNPRDGLKYMWIPPGTFTMGCSPGDNECYDDEKPAHQVAISKAFWLGQTDVTQAAYQRVNGSNPSHFKGPELPVDTINWDLARSYCEAVGGRLPTDAEWEYAARAGAPGARYGNLDAVAWYSGNSGKGPHDVGRKQPNAFGLYDMLGNVWQWVADWYGEKYYAVAQARDPAGPPSGTLRTLRGGSWFYDARNLRVSYRHRFEPGNRNNNIGLRCVSE